MSSLTGVDDDEVMLNVLRCHLTYSGQVVTNAEARFTGVSFNCCLSGVLHLEKGDDPENSRVVPRLSASLLSIQCLVRPTVRANSSKGFIR